MKTEQNSIKYSQLATILIVFILGMVTALLFLNYKNLERMEFSTLELIGFVFSFVLGSAGLVLSINAIQLGRSSEDAIVKRNDESIKIQNEVFQKTIEVLGRIESSTDVTEKRIEDIIAGRVGQIAEKLSTSNLSDRDKIESELKKSLLEEVTPEEREKQLERKKEREAARTRYNKYHEMLLLEFSNTKELEVLKLSGHGSYDKTGVGLFDGLFKISGKKIGISIFSEEPALEDVFLNGFKDFITKIAHEIADGTIEQFFYVSNKETTLSKKLLEQLNDATKLLRTDLQEKIHVLTGTNEEIILEIKRLTN
jgi:hypothetical protein